MDEIEKYESELLNIGLEIDEEIDIQGNENLYEIVEMYSKKIIEILDTLKFGKKNIGSIVYDQRSIYKYILWNFHDTDRCLYEQHLLFKTISEIKKPNSLLLIYFIQHILGNDKQILGTQITPRDKGDTNHLSIDAQIILEGGF